MFFSCCLYRKAFRIAWAWQFEPVTFILVFFFPFLMLLFYSFTVENVQSHLLSSGNLVPVCLCGFDLYGDGKRTSCFFLIILIGIPLETAEPVLLQMWQWIKCTRLNPKLGVNRYTLSVFFSNFMWVYVAWSLEYRKSSVSPKHFSVSVIQNSVATVTFPVSPSLLFSLL